MDNGGLEVMYLKYPVQWLVSDSYYYYSLNINQYKYLLNRYNLLFILNTTINNIYDDMS